MRHRKNMDRWGISTYSEVRHQVAEVAAGLADAGMRRGDHVALFAATRADWSICDYAILTLGAVTVPVYHTCTTGQLTYIVNNCNARALIVDTKARLEQVLSARDRMRSLELVVVLDRFDLRGGEDLVSLVDLQRRGRRYLRRAPEMPERSAADTGPDDVATVVYTSGSSGLPKGVVLTHGNLVAAVDGLAGALPVGDDDVTVAFLPLSHIYGRVGQFLALRAGVSTAYAQRIDRLEEVLLEVKPTFIFGVPLIYERIYRSIAARARELSPLRKKLFHRALAEGIARIRAQARGQDDHRGPLVERAAELAVFSRLREGFGGRMRFVISGGAALHPGVGEFFRVLGIEILEGYGLTETAAATTVSRLEDNRIGSVGRPIPGIRVRVSPEGEVLIRGGSVFREYLALPEDTDAAFDDEGWFRSGDRGWIDGEGRLILTGRVKDLIITSGAKNIAPQYVEGALKLSPLIGEAMVYGDGRRYVVALLDLQPDVARGMASMLGLDPDDREALARHPEARRRLAKEVELANRRLAPHERVRRFAILPRPLSVGGELTHTMKLRREQLARQYRELLDHLYQDDAEAAPPPAP